MRAKKAKMIITERFSNDPIWVQQLQEELYWGLVSLPFELAKTLYLKAENILNIETRLGIDCSKVKKIDHRILQNLHDSVAAKYRYDNRCNFEMQLSDFQKEETDKDEIKQEWIKYFREKIELLLDIHSSLSRSIVLAAAYPNPDKRGLDAESQIDLIANGLYSQIRDNEENLISERLSLHSIMAYVHDR